jgi:cellulose synthase/poly-beta-1,6-N-acetylglucosamine synthase-like glycosyltransferase
MPIHTRERRKLALIIPAHNEQMVVGDTIRSAIRAGQSPDDIYVVSDGSTDWTVELAYLVLPDGHVLDQPQMGKAMAMANGILNFGLVQRYEWIHIADADGVFADGYFDELRRRLSPKFVAATGHLQSLKGGWIAKYRVFEYTMGLEVMRRIQSLLGTIPVIPGATCILRTEIVEHLDFLHPSLTEDMDLTLQIHRRKLGKIAYIPQAKALTQDPKDFADYHRQILRWYRGGWQMIRRHGIGRRAGRIDAYMGFMVLEEIVLLMQVTLLPIYCIAIGNYVPMATMFLVDLAAVLGITLWAAWLNRRPDIIAAFPLYYVLRFVNLYTFFRAWFEIVVLRKFGSDAPGWTTEGRRYRIAPEALGVANK